MSQLQVTGEAKIRDIQGPVVANSGVISALNGSANQYVRGDGALASFPTVTGGGSSVSFYLNGSVNQGTFGGSNYRQLGENAITGVGTNFSTSTNGLLAQFITDANVPDQTEIPSGNWNIEFYMGVSASSGALASFYVEIYKYDGTTFTLVGTNVATPEFLTNTTTIDAYFTSVAMPLTTLNQTDRIAVRVFANVASKTVTLYTEDNRLCQVVTTFSRGVLSINNLTDQQQYFAVGTSGTNFNIASSVDTHTFNLPVASATNTGKLSSTDWSTFNNKVPYTGATGDVNLGLYNISAQNAFLNGVSGVNGGNLFLKQDIDFGQSAGYTTLYSTGKNLGFVSYVGSFTYNALFSLNSLTNNSTRTYTLPDLSGTLALLEGSQTFSGAKTFSSFDTTFSQGFFSDYAIKIKKGGSITLVNGYVSIGEISGTGTSRIVFGDGNSAFSNSLLFNTTSDKIYTFPNTSGTLALTSDLGAYVTLATTQTISGAKTFSSSPIIDNGTSGIPLRFKQYTSTNFGLAGYTDIIPVGASLIAFSFGQTGANTKTAYFSAANLVNNTPREYIMPNADGTIALLSDLGAYLPLSGGTLTGPLSGTTATFSGLGTFYQLTMTGATAGRIFYAQTGGVVSQSGNLNWNETNGMLGVGTPNPSAVITAFSTNAATQFKAAGTAPAFTFSNTLTSPTLGCVFGLATSANHFITGTAAGDMAIANQSTTAGAIVFGTGTAEKMRMSASGRLLVGTSVDSGALFQVAGAATFSSSVDATRFISNVTNNYGLVLNRSGVTTYNGMSLQTANVAKWFFGMRENLSSNNLIFYNEGTGADQLVLTTAGNVGIGTSSPLATLHLNAANTAFRGQLSIQSTDFTQITFYKGATTSTDLIAQIYSEATGNYDLRVNNSSSTGALIFGTNSGTERMRITSGGSLLVGSSTATGGFDHSFKNLTNQGTVVINQVSNAGNPCFGTWNNATSGDNIFVKLYINAGGNEAGSIDYFRAGGVARFNTTSDANLKNIIGNADIKKSIDILNSTKIKEYSWKDDVTNKVQVGVIAQELYKTFKGAVSKGSDDELFGTEDYKTWGVDKTAFTFHLIAGWQKHEQIINDLQAQIEELKALNKLQNTQVKQQSLKITKLEELISKRK